MAEVQAPNGAQDARSLDFYQGITAHSAINDESRQLLIKYAKIPPEEVNAHVDRLREKAFAIFPYPCIGMYRFLDLSLVTADVYLEILRRVKGGEYFLDLGCCFGQEIRQLIADGAPPENLHGSDLEGDFIDLGFDLFRDRDCDGAKVKWYTANVFDEKNTAWQEMRGRLAMIYTGSFFHLFDYAEQLALAKLVVSLLKDKPNVLLVGRQVGHSDAGVFATSACQGEMGAKLRYRHNVESWAAFWEEVGVATGTKWEVESFLDPPGVGLGELVDKLGDPRLKGARRMRFVNRRIG